MSLVNFRLDKPLLACGIMKKFSNSSGIFLFKVS